MWFTEINLWLFTICGIWEGSHSDLCDHRIPQTNYFQRNLFWRSGLFVESTRDYWKTLRRVSHTKLHPQWTRLVILSKTSLHSWCISTKAIHKITNLWKFELNWSSKLRENIYKKKTPLSHVFVCFHMLDFETSSSKSHSWKINYF